MWDFSRDGELYFERATNGFLSELFDRWSKLGANHSLTIVLFSRTLVEEVRQSTTTILYFKEKQ